MNEHKQFNLADTQQVVNPQSQDWDSSPNLLHTAKAVKLDQNLGIGSSPEPNARMATYGQYYSVSNPNSTVTATANIDWSKGNTQRMGLTQTTTLTFTNIKPGGRYILEVQQDETGSRAITWPANVVWPGGSAATPSLAGKIDLYAFYNNGSSTFASSSLNY